MIRNVLGATLASGAVFALSALAQGADPSLGRNLAAACANCHGTNGMSVQGMPNLAGQQRAYLVQQMQDFRTGKRPATINIAESSQVEAVSQRGAHFSATARDIAVA